MVAVSGNTYPVKDQLRALGGRWDGDARVWRVPESRAAEARALVTGAPRETAGGSCAGRERPSGPLPLPDGWIQVSIGEGYGGQSHSVGEVVMAHDGRGPGLAYRLPEGTAPGSCWTVTECRSRYIREDGMSFGVGDERGYIFTTRLRPATDEEAAPVIARAQAQNERFAARRELSGLFDALNDQGVYEEGSHVLTGEEIFIPDSGQRIYGAGRWFVIESGRIWTVKNNGMDGDDWSGNNVTTGGAGAIGRYVAYNTELANGIRSVAARAK